MLGEVVQSGSGRATKGLRLRLDEPCEHRAQIKPDMRQRLLVMALWGA